MLCCIFSHMECAVLRCIFAPRHVESSAVLCWVKLCCVFCSLPRRAVWCFSVLRCAWLCLAVLRCASLLMCCLPLACCIMRACFWYAVPNASRKRLDIFCFLFFWNAELAWCWRLRKHCPRTCWTINVYGYTHGWALVNIYIYIYGSFSVVGLSVLRLSKNSSLVANCLLNQFLL